MTKEILTWDKAREKILAWMKIVADVVTGTMWPKWRNVILEKMDWNPLITNDWVTIAREIELEDKFENMGAKMIIESALKTNMQAWDGTTTATLLTYEIAKEGLKYINSWVNAVRLKDWIKKASELVIQELEKNAKKISSREEIEQVWNISAGNNEIGGIIAEAMEQVGNNGIISVEEWQMFGLQVEITKWMEFDSGFISPYMVTNNKKMVCEMQNVPILITDKKISNMNDILPVLEKIIWEWKKDLVIIAEDISGDALTTVILNKLKWILNILAIKVPHFAENKKDFLQDLATLTWANVIKEDLSMKLENTSLEDLWDIWKIVSTQEKTTIIDAFWNEKELEDRVQELKNSIAESDSNFKKEELIKRLAKLDSWVAVIKVWAASEIEIKELKLRIEDALNATRAATFEWIVAWGWIAFLKARKILDNLDFWNSDENLWINILKQSLKSPLIQIAKNAWKDTEQILEKVEDSDNINFWYNAFADEFVDMLEVWIIDPAMVERVALEEAVSLAWMFLTTQSAVGIVKSK